MKEKVIYFITSSMSVNLLKGQLDYMANSDYDIHLVSSPGKELASLEKEKRVRIITISVAREISLRQDLISLFKILGVLIRLKPKIVNYSTPKAALLASISAYFIRVPIRIYTLRGLRLETAKGFKKQVLIFMEKITCFCSNKIICVSKSLEEKAIELGLADERKTIVLGAGSSNGVIPDIFKMSEQIQNEAGAIRQKYFIDKDTPVIGFIGRVVRDKGIKELIEAFKKVSMDYKNLKLLLLGSYEEGDPLPGFLSIEIENNPNIIYSGDFDYNIVPYYHVMDILVLPTYREGFPNVVLEAAAASKPVITTDATGAVDSVLDGQTGFIVPVGNSADLAEKISFLLNNPEAARQYGEAGRKRVEYEFQSSRIWEELDCLYRTLIVLHKNY